MTSSQTMIFPSLLVIISSAIIIVDSSNSYSCNDTSPECLKTLIQSVIPDFVKEDSKKGLHSLDPFPIDHLTLNLAGNLLMEFRHGSSKGLRNCIIDSARLIEDLVEKVNNTMDLRFHCNLTIKGKYKSTGQLFMFTLNGDGLSMIKCKNIKFQFLAKLGSRLEEDGKKYLEIKEFQSSHLYEGQVYYRMTNLIKGNQMLSDLVLEFMNRNWKLVAEEFGKPIVDFGITSILRNVKKLLKSMSQEELVGSLNGFNV